MSVSDRFYKSTNQANLQTNGAVSSQRLNNGNTTDLQAAFLTTYFPM